MTTATIDFTKRLDQTAEDTEALLAQLLNDTLLPDEIARPKRLMDAMRYSTLGGGKRLRPFLVVESAAVFGVPRDSALLAGAALECIHCYSLIHDDLPAMDNSDLRRGRPTLPQAYDDATAILAGDSLLTLAFDIVTRDEIHNDAKVRLLLTRALARAAGIGGMAGGPNLPLARGGPVGGPAAGARRRARSSASPLRRNIRRPTITAVRSAKPSRSPTTCSTSRAMPPRSASRPAPMRRWARPPSSPSSESMAPSSGSVICWQVPTPRFRSSAPRGMC